MESVVARRPRLFYGWVVVACAWAMYMLNQAAFTWGFTVFVDPLGKEFGWSRTSITLAWALSLGWGLVVSPWFGKALDRFGPRWTTAIGGLLGGLGWALIPSASSYWQFLVYFVLLVGTGINGAVGLSGTAAVAQWFKVRRSLAMGIYFTGSGGAGLLLIPALSALIEAYGWRTGAAALGVLVLATTAVAAPLLRHKPEQYGLKPDGELPANPKRATAHAWDFWRRLPLPKHKGATNESSTLAEALRSAAFWMFTTAIFLRYVGMGITQVHQMPHMLAQDISLAAATAAISLSLTVNIPSRVLVGWMGDLYDKKWLLNLLAIAGGFALLALAFASPGATGLIWAYAALWGVGLAMLPLQASWLADTYGRKHYGSISAMSNSLTLSGRIAGALGAAVAFDLLGSYQMVMLLGAGGFALGAVLLALLPSPRPVATTAATNDADP
ncbi:MAG: MFS transporter [Chloroflexi bacterium]|nr:MFS transporter [Chloroflexota bacterium]